MSCICTIMQAEMVIFGIQVGDDLLSHGIENLMLCRGIVKLSDNSSFIWSPMYLLFACFPKGSERSLALSVCP